RPAANTLSQDGGVSMRPKRAFQPDAFDRLESRKVLSAMHMNPMRAAITQAYVSGPTPTPAPVSQARPMPAPVSQARPVFPASGIEPSGGNYGKIYGGLP